jgi:L-ascorbate metabolism protein UlaG (beta-lactamase superfamily)
MTMIQPVRSGAALLHEIDSTQPAPGQVAIWWLGQSGYAIKSASTFIYVDLYLSDHLTAKYAATDKPHLRMTAAPLCGADITNAQLIFASHKHSDHLDPGTLPDLFRASPKARLVLPAAVVDYAVGLGLDHGRLIPTRGDEILDLQGFRVHSIPSAHPGLDYTETDGYPFLGYGFDFGGVRLYHSGDTIVYDGLAERLRAFLPHLIFLPINGATVPGTPPNMNADEAIAIAGQIGKPLLIPHHYDMFTFNTADVIDFARKAEAAGQPYRLLRCSEMFTFPPQEYP